MIPLYQPKVRLNDQHRYFHENGDEYIGFSRLFDEFMAKPFNSGAAAYASAKSEGCSAQSILDRWDDQRKEGVRIDDCIDLYARTGTYRPEDEDIIDGVKVILSEYKDYDKSYGQLVLYSEKYRVAGMCDRLSTISNRKDCPIVMSDFKCFEKEISHVPSGTRFLYPPFNHLANTKYIKTCFQLSFYSCLFEELTGRPAIRQFIHWIDPKTMRMNEEGVLNVNHKLIPVPYMKSDVILFLETYKEKIINLTKAEVISAF